jgi:hypothetical protein
VDGAQVHDRADGNGDGEDADGEFDVGGEGDDADIHTQVFAPTAGAGDDEREALAAEIDLGEGALAVERHGVFQLDAVAAGLVEAETPERPGVEGRPAAEFGMGTGVEGEVVADDLGVGGAEGAGRNCCVMTVKAEDGFSTRMQAAAVSPWKSDGTRTADALVACRSAA